MPISVHLVHVMSNPEVASGLRQFLYVNASRNACASASSLDSHRSFRPYAVCGHVHLWREHELGYITNGRVRHSKR